MNLNQHIKHSRGDSTRTWIILGATSAIAESFARLVAAQGYSLLLVARNEQQLDVIAKDISLRFNVVCQTQVVDFSSSINALLAILKNGTEEFDLFIAHAVMVNNVELTDKNITTLIDTNILSTVQIIHAYWQREQIAQRIIFLSSVAAGRGRGKNSLYGASKAAIECYLEGLQQTAGATQNIVVMRLGYIDTRLTYGEPSIFYAPTTKACAKACWKALASKKRTYYYPFFWKFITLVISRLPFFVYKRFRF